MNKWQRVDGALFGWDPNRPITDFTDYLERHRILACVDGDDGGFFAVRFLVDDEERVAISKGSALASGIDLTDLIADIATTFDVDAAAGEHVALANEEAFDQEIAELEDLGASEEDAELEHDHENGHDVGGDGIRAVTILSGGVMEVAALARRLGEPIVVRPLDGRSIVLTEEGDSLPAADEIGAPSLQILNLAERFAALYEDDSVIASVSWGVTRTVTPSGVKGAAAEALDGLTHDTDLAEAVSALGGDSSAITAALNPVEGSPDSLLAALGASDSVWEFLSDECAAHEVEDVVVITPPTRGETLSYLVGEVIPDTPIVERFEELERDHPVATRAPSASAILIGSGLAAFGLTRAKGVTRSLLVGIGGVIVANGIAGLSITELISSVRENRPEAHW